MKDRDELFLKALGERIRSIRQEQNLSQDDLAVKANIEQKLISKIELGTNSPSITTLDKIARALGLTVSQITDIAVPQQKK